MKFTKILATLGVMLGLVFAGSSAYATTPANALLKNTASLTYTGAASPITADVTVTVSLVRAAAVINGSAPADTTVTENQQYTQTYKIIAQANGPDTYEATANGSPTNVTGSSAPTVTVTTGGDGSVPAAGFKLGASALAVAEPGGETVIRVPDDATPGGTGADAGEVNGLKVGDKVVFDGSTTEYTIATITYPGGTDLAEITLTGGTVPTLPVGTGIYEVGEITTTVTNVGTSSGTPSNINVTLEVEPTATPGTNTFTDSVTVTVAKLTFKKLVRNVTQDTAPGAPADCEANPGFSGGEAITTGGQKYCSQGVTGQPGQILEYLIRVTNSGATDITGAVLSDVLDEFTTYVADSTAMNTTDVDDAASAPVFPMDSGNGGGLQLQSTGFTTAADGNGTVGDGETVDVIYRVTVNNI